MYHNMKAVSNNVTIVWFNFPANVVVAVFLLFISNFESRWNIGLRDYTEKIRLRWFGTHVVSWVVKQLIHYLFGLIGNCRLLCHFDHLLWFLPLWWHMIYNPANTRRWPNVGLLLVHRLRHWPNVETTLGQRLVFAGRLILSPRINVNRLYPLESKTYDFYW